MAMAGREKSTALALTIGNMAARHAEGLLSVLVVDVLFPREFRSEFKNKSS